MSHTSLVGGKDRPKFRCLLSQEKGILFFKFIAPQTVWKWLESQRPAEQCLSLSIKTAKNKTQGMTVLGTGHLQRDVNGTVPPSHGLGKLKHADWKHTISAKENIKYGNTRSGEVVTLARGKQKLVYPNELIAKHGSNKQSEVPLPWVIDSEGVQLQLQPPVTE